jgi:DNA-binding transcriptional LysR family regulator
MNLFGIDLNLLVLLAELLREKSVSRAARRAGLSQPAASHALRRLRELFDDELLVRVGRHMVPTPRALELGPPRERALASMSALVGPPSAFDPRTATRSFRVAAADLQQIVLFPRLLAILAREAPGLDLAVDPGSQRLPERLASGELDLALFPMRSRDRLPGLREQVLLHDHFVCLVRRGHPLARRKPDLKRFAAARHAFVAPGGARGGVVDDALAEKGLTRRIAFQAAQFLVAPFVIAETDLVITVPAQVARRFTRLLPLTAFTPPVPLGGFSISLVWHERLDDDPAHRFLREVIRRSAPDGREPATSAARTTRRPSSRSIVVE